MIRSPSEALLAGAGMLDAELSLAADKGDLLAVVPGCGTSHDAKLPFCRTASHRRPGLAHMDAVIRGFEHHGRALASGCQPEIAKTCFPLPGSKGDAARAQRVFVVLVDQQALSVDNNLERSLGHAHDQGNPAVDGDRVRHVAYRFVVLPVPGQTQMPGGSVQGHFVPVEMIGSHAGIAQLDDQTRVPRGRVGEKHLDTDLAAGERNPLGHQLRSRSCRRMEHTAVNSPLSPISEKTSDGLRFVSGLKMLVDAHA